MMKSLFPPAIDSEWVAPTKFPDLSMHKCVAVYLETCDTALMKAGPGWPTKRGYVIGIAVAADGFAGYYPIAHEGGGNMDE